MSIIILQKTWTWSEYHQDVRTAAKAFISLGMKRFQSVCILGFNSPEWFMSAVGAIFAGGFSCGIYPTNGTGNLQVWATKIVLYYVNRMGNY